MIVMKFGGTSVATAERIEMVARLVKERLALRPVVVVSALARVTDTLIQGAELALQRDPESETVVEEIKARHREVVTDLLPAGPLRLGLFAHITGVVNELRAFFTGVHNLGELTPRTLDAISGMGERLSCEIVAAALQHRGMTAQAMDGRSLIVTDEDFGRATPLLDETTARVHELLLPVVQQGLVPVVSGFIGSTRRGIATTLGRGGSDYSAAVIGATLPVEAIQIWTDVDGMMTVDPKVVPGARVLKEVSFEEAAELAYFGAKILHPATIKPAVEKGIPVGILNTLNPSAPGTLVTARSDAPAGEPRAIAFKKGISVILISQPRMLMAYGFVARVFDVFQRHKTSVDLIATSEVSISLTVDDPERLPAIEAELSSLGEVDVLRGMAIISVVGRGFVRQAGLAGRIFQSLRDINVVMISFGASDVNVSFVVNQDRAEDAVRRLHHEFFEAHREAPAPRVAAPREPGQPRRR
ncbi:MAG TPA: lysine-sensitive aspartokinase 3 [Vicinamibacteria bacterium]|nr:lysine-sensitive aspartokinase 3 [Vicinamibacteria bacterium]